MGLITIEETAKILKRSESEVRYYTSKGLLVRYGEYKDYFYDKESVEILAKILRQKDEDLEARKHLLLKKEEADTLLDRYTKVNKRLRKEIEYRKRACSLSGLNYKPREFMNIAIDHLVAIGMLSDRRAYIVKCLVNGDTIDEVAKKMGLSVSLLQIEWVKAVKSIKNIDYDKIHKEQCDLKKSVDILNKKNKVLENKVEELERMLALKDKEKEEVNIKAEKRTFLESVRISDLVKRREISIRLANVLRSVGVETLYDLKCYPKEKLPRLKNVGKKTISEVEQLLKEVG